MFHDFIYIIELILNSLSCLILLEHINDFKELPKGHKTK